MPDKQVIAAFDFDNTLTTCDSLLPFLFYTHGRFKTALKLLTLVPFFFLFCCNLLSRQKTKEKILTFFFKRWPVDEFKKWGNLYAAEKLDKFINPEAYEKLKWHQLQGHRCLIVSASIDVYLLPWAANHGLEGVLASEPNIDELGQVTGELKGQNCWGAEKQRRLLEYAGPRDHYKLYAYGDSRGDRELLEMADHSFIKKFF